MSTENTQTDVSPSGASTESVSTSAGTPEVTQSASASSDTVKPSLDGLKKMAKESANDFKSKLESEAIAEAKAPAAPVEQVKPAWSPNYKYKAALQEKEVDEFWRPLMKDADSEKKVIEALQKLDGFDAVKESRESVMKQFESLQGDYRAQAEVINRVESALERKDLSSVFRQLGVTQQDIFNWTHQQLQMMELPPEQRRAMEEAEQTRLQKYEMEEKMSQFQRMYEDQAVQARTMQLDFTLSRPEVQSAASNWDTLTGQPGAFRNLVIQEAQTAFYQEQVDLTAEQAVQRVMQKFGKVVNTGAGSQAFAPQAQAPMAAQAAQAPVVQAPQAKPVIPNVSGKGTAPIKKVPKSLDDLKKIAKELNA
jgi:hypothetical protein